MGTRFAIEIVDNGETLVTCYGQYDGYPTGAGADIAEFLKNRQYVNGFSEKAETISNGAGDFAAQLVAYFKSKDGMETGGFYIRPKMKTRGDHGEEWIYQIKFTDRHQAPMILVYSGDVTFFGAPNEAESFKLVLSASPTDFQNWIDAQFVIDKAERAARWG